MKLSSYLLGLLILANLIVYFWPDRLNTGEKLYAPKEDIKPHFLRLNKEIEDKFYAKQNANKIVIESEFTPPSLGGEVATSSDPSGSSSTAALTTSTAALTNSIDSNDCYRLGPFLHAANYELAQAVLLKEDIDYRKTKRVAKESNVYRVYLGPFANPALMIDARAKLNTKKIFDHFVRKEPNGELIISLGIYSSSSKATSAVELFSDSLTKVRQRSETITLPDSFWLHFTIPPDELSRSELDQIDWGETSAKVGRFQCLG